MSGLAKGPAKVYVAEEVPSKRGYSPNVTPRATGIVEEKKNDSTTDASESPTHRGIVKSHSVKSLRKLQVTVPEQPEELIQETKRQESIAKVGEVELKIETSKGKQLFLPDEWLLNPSSPQLRNWDVVMVVLLLFTAVVTPFEVGFLNTSFNFLFVLNRFVDFLFFLDVIKNFVTPIFDSNKSIWINKHLGIAKSYISGWFILDVASILPFDSLGLVMNSNAISSLKIVRVIRLLRLLKLIRIFKASKIITRWERNVTFKYAHMNLAKFIVMTLFFAHWMGCAFRLVADLEDADDNWLLNYFQLTHKAHLSDVTPWHQYQLALYWSVMTLTTIGYGDVPPVTHLERLVAVCCMIVGASVYAYVIGAICGIVAAMNEELHGFHRTMDNLNSYLEDNSVPQELRFELRDFFRYSRSVQRNESHRELLMHMSPTLRGRLALHCNRRWLNRVHFFNPPCAEEAAVFSIQLAMVMRPEVYAPKDVLCLIGSPAQSMYIMVRGLVNKRFRFLRSGQFFGEDFILTDAKRNYTVRAVTFVEVQVLTKLDLERVLMVQELPKTRHMIRQAAIRLSLLREVVRRSHAIRQYRMSLLTSAAEAKRLGRELSQHMQEQVGAIEEGSVEEDGMTEPDQATLELLYTDPKQAGQGESGSESEYDEEVFEEYGLQWPEVVEAGAEAEADGNGNGGRGRGSEGEEDGEEYDGSKVKEIQSETEQETDEKDKEGDGGSESAWADAKKALNETGKEKDRGSEPKLGEDEESSHISSFLFAEDAQMRGPLNRNASSTAGDASAAEGTTSAPAPSTSTSVPQSSPPSNLQIPRLPQTPRSPHAPGSPHTPRGGTRMIQTPASAPSASAAQSSSSSNPPIPRLPQTPRSPHTPGTPHTPRSPPHSGSPVHKPAAKRKPHTPYLNTYTPRATEKARTPRSPRGKASHKARPTYLPPLVGAGRHPHHQLQRKMLTPHASAPRYGSMKKMATEPASSLRLHAGVRTASNPPHAHSGRGITPRRRGSASSRTSSRFHEGGGGDSEDPFEGRKAPLRLPVPSFRIESKKRRLSCGGGEGEGEGGGGKSAGGIVGAGAGAGVGGGGGGDVHCGNDGAGDEVAGGSDCKLCQNLERSA